MGAIGPRLILIVCSSDTEYFSRNIQIVNMYQPGKNVSERNAREKWIYITFLYEKL